MDTPRDPRVCYAVVCTLALVLAGCDDRAPSAAPAPATLITAAPPTAPDLLVAGCEALVARTCELRPGAALRLWAPVHRDTPLQLAVDGADLPLRWIPAEDGLRAVLEPAPTTGQLVVRAADASWRWTLDLREVPSSPQLAPLQALVAAGDHARAAAAITTALPRLRARPRAEALALLADLAFQSDAVANSDVAHADAFAAAVDAGLFTRAADLATVPLHVATTVRWDPERAARWLDRLATLTGRATEARLRHAYYTGMLAQRRGDLRRAMPQFGEYARLAGALGLERDQAAALLMRGWLATQIGDDAAAATTAQELRALAPRLDPHNRASALNSLAWFNLEARARGRAADDPEPDFAIALATFETAGDLDAAAETRINLALTALQRGDAAGARAALRDAAPRTRHLARWHLFVAARIDALGRRHRDALRRFERLAEAAVADDDRTLEWRALVGAGEALEALGDDDAALRRYSAAVALHRNRLATLAIHHGPERLAAAGDLAAQRAVALLLRRGRHAEAACVARDARAQVLANLLHVSRDSAALTDHRQARADLEAAREAAWQLPRRRREELLVDLRARARALDDQLDASFAAATPTASPAPRACADLRPPAPGELLLLYYPLERGHAAFAITDRTVRGLTLADPPPDADPVALSAHLLGPFAREVAAAARLRLLVSGRLGREPLHALLFPADDPAGARLIDHAPVVYALDLPRTAAAHPPPRRALQLAPPSNLLGAAGELERAAAALRDRGVAVITLHGDEPDLRARIGDTDLLHYVGHARGDGWRGALDLGGERELTVADLLTLRAPPVAVLGGCETGLLDPSAHAGGMSLAHALLVAGADAVLATDGEVADDVAAEMTPAILAALADGLDPAEALRAAQRAGLRRSADFARFRAFVP